MADALNRLRWQAVRWRERAGLPGIVAIALVLAAALGWLAWARPLAQAVQAQQEQVQAMQRQVAEAAHRPSDRSAPLAAATQLAVFEQRFGDERERATAFAQLWAIAGRQGLQLPQAEFRVGAGADGALSRYAIVLPVKTDYASLRRFIDDALRALPGLALEELSLHRDDPRSPLLDAQLRFVLFVARRS